MENITSSGKLIHIQSHQCKQVSDRPSGQKLFTKTTLSALAEELQPPTEAPPYALHYVYEAEIFSHPAFTFLAEIWIYNNKSLPTPYSDLKCDICCNYTIFGVDTAAFNTSLLVALNRKWKLLWVCKKQKGFICAVSSVAANND